MFAEGAEALFPGHGQQIEGLFANVKKKKKKKKEAREGEQEVQKGAWLDKETRITPPWLSV